MHASARKPAILQVRDIAARSWRVMRLGARPAVNSCAVLAADVFGHEEDYAPLQAAGIAAAAKISRSGGAAAELAAPSHRRDRIQRAKERRSRVTASVDAAIPARPRTCAAARTCFPHTRPRKAWVFQRGHAGIRSAGRGHGSAL